MKKSILIALVAVACGLCACAKDKIIPYAQLPVAAQQIVQDNFNADNIAYITLDRELFDAEYEVRFNDGVEIKFERDGSLKSVDCKNQAVPEALVPAVVKEQVLAQFPQAVIVEWGKDDWGWKAELNNKLDLKFNSQFEFVGIDD